MKYSALTGASRPMHAAFTPMIAADSKWRGLEYFLSGEKP